jgi:anti-sigma B factor antagonist
MLTLTTHNLGDVTIFRCTGRLTAGDGEVLRTAVLNQLQLHVVVLDLTDIGAVDAAGLGTLVSVRTWAKATGTELKLMNLTPRMEELLELTDLRSAFEVCSVREMLDLLCRVARKSQLEASRAEEEAPAAEPPPGYFRGELSRQSSIL